MSWNDKAKTYWDNTPKEIQFKIINNMFCMCTKENTTIIDYIVFPENKHAVLRGKCIKRGNNVERMLDEPFE
ncbi:MAG: hypothetical protein FWF50_04170 [Defluviitaleaceae bacterium]|nr:hypothetical protein [Defluviitaleaceae bacterium]